MKKNTINKLGYRPALDGLRALAIILVVASHANFRFFQNGGIGVSVFFTLSGFLITTLLLEEYNESNDVSLKRFYIRRTFRLFPALYVMLLLLSAYAIFWCVGALKINLLKEVLAAALYVSNISWKWGWGTEKLYIYHTWSLGVEEQFYLIWPFILLFFMKNQKIKLLSVILFFFVGTIWLLKFTHRFSYVAGDIIKESIFIGCLIALIRNKYEQYSKIPLVLAMIALITILIIGIKPVTIENATVTTLLIAVCSGLLILSLLQENILTTCFSYNPIVFIGKISYSLYIWHAPVFRFFYFHPILPPRISFVTKIIVSILFSLASWYLIEKKTTQLGRKLSERFAIKK